MDIVEFTDRTMTNILAMAGPLKGPSIGPFELPIDVSTELHDNVVGWARENPYKARQIVEMLYRTIGEYRNQGGQ
jgi:hypothetical protein